MWSTYVKTKKAGESDVFEFEKNPLEDVIQLHLGVSFGWSTSDFRKAIVLLS